MIFVILGTQDKPFTRLLQEIDVLITSGIIQEKVIVQAGSTKYKSKNMEIHKMIPVKKFLNYIEESDYIITHGGVGSILDAMKKNKKIIAIPRQKAYGEHENDHQIQIVEKFAKEKYLIGCNDVTDLKKAILKVDTFQPKKCTLGNETMVELITNYIESTSPERRKDRMIYGVYAIIALILQFLLYILFHTFQGVFPSLWMSWLLSYILLIVFMYPKRNLIFEILWGLCILCVQVLCLDWVCYHIIPCLGITIIIDSITYFVHTLFYMRW